MTKDKPTGGYKVVTAARRGPAIDAAIPALEICRQFLAAANTGASIESLCETFLTYFSRITGFAAVGIRVFPGEGTSSECSAFRGFKPCDYARHGASSISSAGCVCTDVVVRTVVRVLDKPETGRLPADCIVSGYRCAAVLPVSVGGRSVGLVHLADDHRVLDPQMISLLEIGAMQLGSAIERVSALNALKAQRRRLYAVLDELPAFVCLVAPDYSIRFANARFRRLFGDTETRCFERIWRTGKPCLTCPASTVFEKACGAQWEWTSPAGSVFQSYAYPFWEADGSLLLLELGIDVTERKKAENALQVERTKLKRILNAMDDGVYIVNPQYQIEYLNPVLERDFGPVRGRKCHEYFHDRSAPCEWCKNPQVFEGESIQWRWHSEKTGRTYDLFDTPILNEAGVTCKLEFFHDITERERACRELIKSEERYRLLVETMNEGLVMVDHNHICTYANDQFFRLLGRTPDEVLGRALTDLLDEENIRILVMQRELRRKGGEAPYEIGWTRPDGRQVVVRVSPRTIVGCQGTYAGSFGVVTDITEHRRAEEALRDSERRLRFLSAQILKAQETERSRISRELHDELGQGLALIKMQLGFVQERLRRDQIKLVDACQETRDYMDQIVEEVRRLAHDLSPAVLENLGFMIALRRLASDFRRCSGISCSLRVDDIDRVFSASSKTMLYRVFQEAFTNIRKHSGAKRVRVSIRKCRGVVRCHISDDGVGFDCNRVTSGTSGLGLSTMQERIHMLGGTFGIVSEMGRGTRIDFEVPRGGGTDDQTVPYLPGG